MEICTKSNTTNGEIHKQGLGSLTNAVIQAEKILKNKVQDVSSPLGPRELAIKAQDALKKLNNPTQNKKSANRASAP